MTDRELLEALHTQIANHLVMPAASQAQASIPVGGTIVRHGKGHFGPGVTTFTLDGVQVGDIIRLEIAGAASPVAATIYGPAGLHWEADPAPLVAGAGQVLPAPTAPMEGPYAVEIHSDTPGVVWWP